MIRLIILLPIFCFLHTASSQVVATFIKRMSNDTCGIPTAAPIVQQVSRPLTYMGGLIWIDDGRRIAYADRYGPGQGRYTPVDGRFNRMDIFEGFESIMIIPIKDAGVRQFVVGLDNRLIFDNVLGPDNEFVLDLSDFLIVTNTSEKFQSGKCDDKGRLWYSSDVGNLYRIENLGTPDLVLNHLECAGGMAWTQDHKLFYIVDYCKDVIYRYNFTSENGTLSGEKIIFRLHNIPNLKGHPYDVVTDTNGSLWISMLESGSLIQYDADEMKVLWQISIPAPDVVSLAFGGLDKKTLYVGTGGNKGDGKVSGAGALFSVSGLGVTGFAGNHIAVPKNRLH